MKDWVNGTEVIGEFDGERLWSGLSDNLEWSKITSGELRGRLRCLDVFCSYVSYVANLEVWRRGSPSISDVHISELCVRDLLLKKTLQFVDVDCVVTSACRGDVSLRVHRNVGVVTLVGEER